jgi:hypothetical protein
MTDFRALGRKGGLTTSSRHDMRAAAARARAASPNAVDYFYPLVDVEADGEELDESERDRRAHVKQRIYFREMAERRAKKNGGKTTKAAGTPPAADALTEAHQLGPDGRPSG